MDRFWREALGLGVLCLLVGALTNQADDGNPMGPAISVIGAVLIAAGLLMWWVKETLRVRREKRDSASS